jgi:hypothetical protein
LEIKITIDDAALERLVQKVLERMAGKGQEQPEARPPRVFLANCGRPADLLKVIEAPDTAAAGIRAEPHWKILQEVAAGDVIVFRDRRGKALVGHARAEKCEREEHRHQPGVPAIRWWLADPVTYARPLPDKDFIEMFQQKQATTPGFSLLQRDGTYFPKAYLYPLDDEVFKAISAVSCKIP